MRPHDDLDAYLDGTLDDAQRLRFERELTADPELAREVELARAIDASLGRRFVAPEPSVLSARLRERAAAGGPGPSRFAVLALVTSLSAAAGLAVLFWPGDQPGDADPQLAQAPPGAGPGSAEGLGFEACAPLGDVRQVAYELCTFEGEAALRLTESWEAALGSDQLPLGCSVQSFASLEDVCREHYGEPLHLDPHELVRIEEVFAPEEPSSTTALRAVVSGEPSMLFVDRLADDPRPAPSSVEGLRLFRAELGGFVLYELTPHAEPCLLPLVRE